jgi:hypothetical protein
MLETLIYCLVLRSETYAGEIGKENNKLRVKERINETRQAVMILCT